MLHEYFKVSDSEKLRSSYLPNGSINEMILAFVLSALLLESLFSVDVHQIKVISYVSF